MTADIIEYYIFDPTGRITQTGLSNQESFAYQVGAEGTTVVQGKADYYSQYILDGVPTDRPSFAKFDTTSVSVGGEATITGLPNPTTVTVNGTAYTVTDGEFVLTATTAGQYSVIVSAWPYLDYQETIICA